MKKTFFICVKVLDRTAVQKLEGIGNKAYPFALYTLTSQRFRKLVRCAFLRVHADEYLRALGHSLEYLAGGFIGISVGKKLDGRLRNRIFDAHKFQPVRLVGEAQSVLSHFSEHRIYEPRRELRTVIFASFTLSLTAALSGILSMNRS